VSSPYGPSARVYDALFRDKDYRGAVGRLRRIIREAHPTDGWRMESNDRADIAYPQPTDLPGRTAVAQRCAGMLKLPLLSAAEALEK